MKRWLALTLLVAVAATVAWLLNRNAKPPEVVFSPVTRETVVSLLSTNGKVEPAEWRGVVAEREGRIASVHVQRGQQVAAGAPLVTFADPASEAEIAAAASRLETAKAALEAVNRGGSSAELTQIDNAIEAARMDREAAVRDVESLKRLVAKNAATRAELYNAEDKLNRLDASIAAQKRRRAALVETGDRAVAESRVREAETSLSAARRMAERNVVRAPIAGQVYELTARAGEWAAPGTALARVGRTDRLRVLIFVDEPDLGRVRAGQSAKVTWDALPDKSWTANVTSVPTQVVAHESRQVGEVIAMAENPDGTLPPGANINVEIVAQVDENALAIPKQALRRNAQATGVFVAEGDRLAWRPIQAGISSLTHVAVKSGDLKEKDLVAVDSDVPLVSGMQVTRRVR